MSPLGSKTGVVCIIRLVTILRQSRRLSVAGLSKGPDRNRSKAARRAASAGFAAGVFAAQKPPLKVIRLGMLRERHIPGYVKLLLPPRQSRGISQRIRTRRGVHIAACFLESEILHIVCDRGGHDDIEYRRKIPLEQKDILLSK